MKSDKNTRSLGYRLGRPIFFILVLIVVGALLLEPLEWLGLIPSSTLYVDRGTLSIYQNVIGLAWAGLTILAFGILLTRYYRLWRRGELIPSLLKRDILSKGGLSFSISALILARVIIDGSQPTAVQAQVATYIPFIIATSIPAIIGMGAFVWWELFVIEGF